MRGIFFSLWSRCISSLAVAAFVAGGCSPGVASTRIADQRLADGRLRVLLETSRSHFPFPDLVSHQFITDNVRCYLATVDLSRAPKDPLAVRLYGPLYSVPEERNAISYEAGEIFSAADRAAAAATPRIEFGADGDLIRLSPRDSPDRPRDRLVVSDTAAIWQARAVSPIPEPLGGEPRHRAVTNSGRYALQKEADGVVRLYDLTDGRRVDDPWLERSFAEYCSREDLDNVHVQLTEDLQHLVILPVSKWERGPNDVLTTFRFDARDLPRVRYGLAYSRPEHEPKLLDRPDNEPQPRIFEGYLDEQALSIGGRLYLFYDREDAQVLVSSDGTDRRVPPVALSKKETIPHMQFYHDPTRHRMVGVAPNDWWRGGRAYREHDEAIVVVRWDYAAGTVQRDEYPLRRLFRGTLSATLEPAHPPLPVHDATAARK